MVDVWDSQEAADAFYASDTFAPVRAAAEGGGIPVPLPWEATAEQELAEFLDAGFTTRNALEVVLGIGTYTMSTLGNRLVRA